MKRFTFHLFLAAMLAFGQAAALAQARARNAANQAPEPAASAPTRLEIRLKAGDRLLYSVLEDPARNPAGASADLIVNSFGQVHFEVSRGSGELITIQAQDRTLREVREELKAKLDKDYYYDATVELKLKEQTVKPGQILMYGAVRNNFVTIQPGEEKKLLEVVLQAGPNEFANLKKVQLSRIDPATGKLESRTVNVEEIKKNPTKDVPVRDGDHIDIPERKIVF